MRPRTILPVLALMASAFLTPAPRAQALDGTWFKVTLNLRGGAGDGSELSNAKAKVLAYVFMQPSAPADGGLATQGYQGAVWSEVTPGAWSQVSIMEFTTLGADEAGMVGPTSGADDAGVEIVAALTSTGGDGPVDFVSVHFTARLKIKLDKEGALKKASFKSFGAVLPEGFDGSTYLFGGGTVKGQSIDPSKLPFSIS